MSSEPIPARKDYVRRLMSRSKASLEGENIRSTIAVKAGIARHTATARHAKNKKRTNTLTGLRDNATTCLRRFPQQ
jgi:hypothetical protein